MKPVQLHLPVFNFIGEYQNVCKREDILLLSYKQLCEVIRCSGSPCAVKLPWVPFKCFRGTQERSVEAWHTGHLYASCGVLDIGVTI